MPLLVSFPTPQGAPFSKPLAAGSGTAREATPSVTSLALLCAGGVCVSALF